MRQQINLYQRSRHTQAPVSAHSLLLVTGIMIAVLLGIWSYGRFAVTRLQRQVELLQLQRQAQTNMASAAVARYGETIDPLTLQQQLTQLKQTLHNRQQALSLLRLRTPALSQGFALRLAALAHPHVEGVWLEDVRLDGQPGIQSLSGRSLNPALVAGYLRALGSEPALAGTRFSEARILGAKYVDEHSETSVDAILAPQPQTTEPVRPEATTTVRFRVDSTVDTTALTNTVSAGSAI